MFFTMFAGNKTILMDTENPGRFDSGQLSAEDRSILSAFSSRRQAFDRYLLQHGIQLFTCPGCGYPTLTERGTGDYCIVCSWEDDGQDDSAADEERGGPNGDLSLTENRLGIGGLLQAKAAEQSGIINTDPQEVLPILQQFNEQLGALMDQAAGQENMEAYQKLVEQLFLSLTRKK